MPRALCPLRSAGDFVDLVKRGFYDGMEIQRADGFVVQTGKPSGDVSRRRRCRAGAWGVGPAGA